MATISLNANSINQMPTMIKQVKKSVEDYKSDLFTIKTQTLNISQSICNLDDVVSSIQASTKTQEDKIDSLNDLIRESEEFISDVVEIDGKVADVINQRKDEFYEEYYYLKPECEKTWGDKAKEALKSAPEWCLEHWKLIATGMLVVAAIIVIVATAGTALTAFSALALAMAKGILIGSAVGGAAGGIAGLIACIIRKETNYKDAFLEGVESGAFGGAISGAISGGLGHILSLGKGTLSLGKLMQIGGISDGASSLVGDFGDIILKGVEMSAGDVIFNTLFAALLGVGGVYGSNVITKRFGLIIQGINKGNGSWKHVWASQSTRSLRHGTRVGLKTILKGIGSKAVDDAWDFVIEIGKNLIDEWKDSWNLNNSFINKKGVLYGVE